MVVAGGAEVVVVVGADVVVVVPPPFRPGAAFMKMTVTYMKPSASIVTPTPT